MESESSASMTPWVVAVLGRLLPTAVLWLAVQHARGGGGSASGVGQEAAKGRSRACATFHVAQVPPIGLDGGESEGENIQGLRHHHQCHVVLVQPPGREVSNVVGPDGPACHGKERHDSDTEGHEEGAAAAIAASRGGAERRELPHLLWVDGV